MRDVRDRATRRLVARMAREVAGRYREAGLFAFFFARGKLAVDPLFATLLERGAIPDADRLVDLGCGQALLQGWLSVARSRFEESRDSEMVATAANDMHAGWPVRWPVPPRVRRYLGIDRSTIDIERARHALASPHAAATGDLATITADAIGACDVVTLFDVLHYLDPARQERLLDLVARALAPAGTLLLRVGDLAERGAARRSLAVDSVVTTMRGYPGRLHRRPLHEWIALLDAFGFDTEIVDTRVAKDDGTSRLANVMLRARLGVPRAGADEAPLK